MDVNSLIGNFRTIITGHYFDFEGRTPRTPFWYYWLVYIVVFIALAIVQSIIHIAFLTNLLALALLLPNLGLGARRLHDTNRSAWWLLIGLVPIIGWALLIWWYCEAGTAGANQFGDDPKAGAAPAATATA